MTLAATSGMALTACDGPVRVSRSPISQECREWIDAQEREIEREAAVVKVFFVEGASTREVQQVRAQLEAMDGVRSVEWTSKDEAFERAKELFKDSPEVMRDLPGNPFPASLDATFDEWPDPEEMDDLLGDEPGVDSVGTGGEKARRALEALREGAGGRECQDNFEEFMEDEGEVTR